jgi:hypothetical protein
MKNFSNPMNFPKSVMGAYLFIGSISRGGGAIFEGFFSVAPPIQIHNNVMLICKKAMFSMTPLVYLIFIGIYSFQLFCFVLFHIFFYFSL